MFLKINTNAMLFISLVASLWGCSASEDKEGTGLETISEKLQTPSPDDIENGSILKQTDIATSIHRDEKNDLDMTIVAVESKAAQKLLGSPTIKVRAHATSYQPVGSVPIPILETVTDEECKSRLSDVAEQIAGQQTAEDQIIDLGGIYVTGDTDTSIWISRASGIYKYSKTKEGMIVPTRFKNFKQAVQAALAYLGEKQLITLVEGEEVDILFVSSVKNAMSTVEEISAKNNVEEWEKKISTIDPKSPLLQENEPEQLIFDKIALKEEFISDFYVGFGRRFNGIPVIGSQLVIRLNGNGETAMLLKQWRAIEALSEKEARISDESLAKLIIGHPEFYKRYSDKEVTPNDITIISRKCGYMDAPSNYRQVELRPGCEVTFKLFDAADENYPVIIVPLDGSTYETLWGTVPVA